MALDSREAVGDGTRTRAVGVGQQRGEQQRVGVEPRTGTVKHQTPEQRGEAAWDRVQRQ